MEDGGGFLKMVGNSGHLGGGLGDSPEKIEEVDFVSLVSRLWKGKFLILFVFFLFVFLGGGYSFLKPNFYKADALLIPAQNQGSKVSAPGGVVGLASLAGVNLGEKGGKLDEALAILKSRKFLSDFISERKLKPVLFSEYWSQENNDWKINYKNKVPTMYEAYAKFRKEVLSVSEDPETGLVTLAIFWKDRKKAAEWANALVGRLNQKIREDEVKRISQKISYLRKQVKNSSINGVRQSLFSIMENQLKSQTVAKTQKQYVFRVIDPAVPADKDKPAGLSFKMVLAISGGLGFVFGIVAFLVWEFVSANFLKEVTK